MNTRLITLTVVLLAVPLAAQADAVSGLQAEYKTQGSGEFTAAAGKALWNKKFVDSKSGKQRYCGSCHTDDLRKQGKHVRTGKVIKPMAPSVNPERLTNIKKIKKWLLRNCKWTMGRECTAQEKGDLLAFLKTL